MDEQIVSLVKIRRAKKVTEAVKTEPPKIAFLDRVKLAKNRLVNRLDEVLLYAVIFFTPLFVISFTNYPISLNKQAFVFFALAFALVIWIFGVVNAGNFKFKATLSSAALFLLLLSSFISWFLNGQSHLGFFGAFGGEPAAPLNILIFFIAFLMIHALLSRDEKKQKASLVLMAVSSVLAVIVWFFISIGKLNLVSGISLVNTVGLSSSFVLFLLAGFFISLGLYFASAGIIRKTIFLAFLALFVFIFIALGFKLVWYIVSLGLAFFIAAYFASKQNFESKKTYLFLAIAVLVVSLIFSFSSSRSSEDTRLTYDSSYNIIKKQYEEGTSKMLFGSGPASFKYSFLQYRDLIIPDISLNRLQFSSSYSAVMDYFSELGVVGGFAILLFFASVIFYGVRLLLRQISKDVYNPLTIALFIATLSSFAVNIFGVSNFTNLFYSFVLSALVVGAYQSSAGREPKVVSFSKNPSQTFFTLILLIILLTSLAYLAFKFGSRYMAEFYFAKAQKVSVEKSEEAFPLLEKAIKRDNQNDAYFKTAADINFSLIKNKLGSLKPEDKKAIEELTQEVKNAEGLYRQAIALNPKEASNFSSIGFLYETVSALDNTLLEQAQKSYEQALLLDPKNADILSLVGKVYYISGKYEEAEKKLSELIEVFPRDPNPRFYLALTLAKKGKKEEALREFEIVKLLDPNAQVDQFINNIKGEESNKEK